MKIQENQQKCEDAKSQFENDQIDFEKYIQKYRKALEQVHKYEIIKSKVQA